MKKRLLFFIGVMFVINAYSQTKTSAGQDIVLKSNGEEMKGKVTQVSDDEIHFIYSGETAEYIVKKADVLKITHSSGRVETFNQSAQPAETRKNDQVAMTATPADHHNKIAILPFADRTGPQISFYRLKNQLFIFLVDILVDYVQISGKILLNLTPVDITLQGSEPHLSKHVDFESGKRLDFQAIHANESN